MFKKLPLASPLTLRNAAALCAGIIFTGLASRPSWAADTSPVSAPASNTGNNPPLLQWPNLTGEQKPANKIPWFTVESFTSPPEWTTVAEFARRDARTPDQLNAMLSAYVGIWRGMSTTRFFSGQRTVAYPVQLSYTLDKEKGHPVLVCQGIYELPGGPQAIYERTWVENGRIVAVLFQNRRKQTFAANSRGSSLVWYRTDSSGALIDFCQVETLRLTVDGGELHTDGYDVEYSPTGRTVLTAQTVDLKLVKN